MSGSTKATMNSFSKTSNTTQSSAEQPYRSRAKSSAEERNKSLVYCPDIERTEQTRFTTQLSTEQRWMIIHYIKEKQAASVTATPAPVKDSIKTVK